MSRLRAHTPYRHKALLIQTYMHSDFLSIPFVFEKNILFLVLVMTFKLMSRLPHSSVTACGRKSASWRTWLVGLGHLVGVI